MPERMTEEPRPENVELTQEAEGALLEMAAPTELTEHPWVQQFDSVNSPKAWVVGGVVLRTLVHGGREPRDMDIQFEGSVEDALALQQKLQESGIPANVLSLEAEGAKDMMGFAAAWRRIKYQHGRLLMDPLAKRFLDERVAIVIPGLPDTDKALQSAQKYVVKEYPGARVEIGNPSKSELIDI